LYSRRFGGSARFSRHSGHFAVGGTGTPSSSNTIGSSGSFAISSARACSFPKQTLQTRCPYLHDFGSPATSGIAKVHAGQSNNVFMRRKRSAAPSAFVVVAAAAACPFVDADETSFAAEFDAIEIETESLKK
jgi:hypothetical protein